ncbi:hypothetical protein SEUBUCD646_0B00920 [Saccharomyces eubayanus]|uniref:YBL029C-A-like protein n=2 Tax=Saccharomyces eubayanus TaxID=1080349 RepID=A0ABN8VMF9_SACEU|nr:hypothetical protein SEUBUCD650_0B00940 [Saccharomyces eubayanus]CAI1843895.1 hypothetical protein SEUBUCD646_0B00920 [Saccharomyces eubayanus]
MSFVPIVCGTRSFDSSYDSVPAHQNLYCPNCHNFSVCPIKRKEFFTVWFIPLLPVFWGKQLHCPICNWRQDFKNEEQLNKVIQEQQNMRQKQPS